MKITEHLKTNERRVSFEIIPPARGGSLHSLLELVRELREYNPPFIDVTSHAAVEIAANETIGQKRQVLRKSPGTLGICAVIQNALGIDAVPHVLCRGFSREETEDFLIDAAYAGIHNVLAIQGDEKCYAKPVPQERTINTYATDLVEQITAMNQGRYHSGVKEATPTQFCIGVGAYPEKHFLSPDIETDFRVLKAKVDAGASYAITQLFFDNAVYFRFVEHCRAAGITIPIVPGLKILTSQKQVHSLAERFHITIPQSLRNEVNTHPHHARAIGIEWASQQAKELYHQGVPCVHFYVMQNATAIHEVFKRL